MKNLNILDDQERENKGLDTSIRFEYQIDWAIYHSLDKLIKNQEFVAFVEFHEDVLFADSCAYNSSIRFELFQIKTTYKSYTSKSLTTITKGSNSTLGKMILGIKDKTFEHQVDKLCLLCLEDINFSHKIKDIDQDYKLNQLHESDKKNITDAIKTQPISEIRDKFEEIFIEEKLLIADEFDISTHLIKTHQSLTN